MPNPPAAFSPLAMVRSMFSSATILRRCFATMSRPGEAKMSPMKSKVVRANCFLVGNKSAPYSRASLAAVNRRGLQIWNYGAHHRAVLAPVI